MSKPDVKPSPSRGARMDLRVAPEQKSLLERAAAVTGASLSGFVVAAALRKAQEVVSAQESIVLSERDRDRFLDLLDNPPPPNPALQLAARRYAEMMGSSES